MTLAPSPLALRAWIKAGDGPAARFLHTAYKGLRHAEVPVVPAVHKPLYALNHGVRGALGWLARVGYWTPLFKSRLDGPAPRLYLFGGLPTILGSLSLRFGADCRVAGRITLSGRSAAPQTPVLCVGDNVDISWMTTIAVGSWVELGKNVRIAGRCFLAGYPGHPLDAAARAAGQPETEDQVGDIILEDDVWLATGVSVMAGVRIGRGTVVAAGSVVTHDRPPGVVAGGVPAKVLKTIP
jgi:acetyltransferase-like isoleucine patch superfamily enzyme